MRGFVSNLVTNKLTEFFEENPGVAKTTALTVITAAVACGLAALMNIPVGNGDGDGNK